MERRTSSSGLSGLHNVVVAGTRGQTVVDARTSLALWLRTARGERNMSLDDVARVTKIQPRILERLESGRAEGLPADVFVRGFVRSFAKCVGLDETEALRRYLACTGGTMAPGSMPTSTVSRPAVLSGVDAPRAAAVVSAMSDLAPATARDLVEVIHVSEPVRLASGSLDNLPKASEVEAAPVVIEAPVVVAPPVAAAIEVVAAAVEPSASGAKKGKKGTKKAPAEKKPRSKRGTRQLASGTPSSPMPVVTQTEIDAVVASTAAAANAAAAPTTPPVAVTVAVDADAAFAAATTAVAAAATSVALDAPRPVYRPNADVDAFATPVDADDIETLDASDADLEAGSSLLDVAGAVDVELEEPMLTSPIVDDEPAVSSAPWTPTMPVTATATTPWKRSYFAPSTGKAPRGRSVVPSLVIDDSDPDSAERELEERAQVGADVEAQGRRSFLPPILLDREDRSARQGGLTLAVILLLIAATLTLSYLMRRPSSSGDGYTLTDTPTTLVG